ncbi:MAG: hypothetical protein JXR37_20790 [Kiritimatiellae bacterium]|nr:hypothetical protein [Kiritimatiellia bacterium]
MAEKKIVCLGGAGGYFKGLLPRLMVCEGLAGSEVVLYDLDRDRAELMAGMGTRLAGGAGTGCRVRACGELGEAVDGADFAISAIGGSGAGLGVYGSRHHNADIAIPAKYGIYQIIGDTGGPAGMMMGLRSVPVYLNFCRELEKRAPNAILLNHSNPMAVLCRAMHKYSTVTTYGICHGVQGGIRRAAEVLGLPPRELECVWIGTNHYYWIIRLLHKGTDVYPELLRRTAEEKPPEGQALTAKLSTVYGYRVLYADDSHAVEFYPFLAQVNGPDDLPYDLKKKVKGHGFTMPEEQAPEPETPAARAEGLRQLEQNLAEVKLPGKPQAGALGEEVEGIMSAIALGRRELCIVNMANGGTIPNLPATAEVEVEGVTDSLGVRPIQVGEAPPILKAILEKRFVWHELVADAAVKGDRKLALQALMLDEMAILPEKTEAMLDELLLASKDLLPQFFG